jgi:recombination protein RecR
MATLPRALQDLIDELSLLPGVGPRTAERYAYHILKSDKNKVARLSKSLDSVHSGVKQCPVTFALINSDEDVSPLYSNHERSKQQIAVVEDPFDVLSLEKTGKFRGTYHVLGGLLSPIDGITPDALTIHQLVTRINDDSVSELILATNASVEGESTALYIQKQLTDIEGLEISRLARGLPVGVDLEYADQITLARALEGRQVV